MLPEARVEYRVSSPAPTGQSAISLIDVTGDVESLLAALDAKPVGVGAAGLRSLAGVDSAVVARLSEQHAILCPHAGPAVVRRVIEALERAGARRAHPAATANDREARWRHALARAASPLAIDLLLDQSRRWREGRPVVPASIGEQLDRLVDPALVLLLGRPNIGKSTLVNTLAGREVSLVADEPGTTRDHVGVLVNFAGLVARVVDCPGIAQERSTGADEGIQSAAQQAALDLVPHASLVLLCGDEQVGWVRVDTPSAPLAVELRVDERTNRPGRPREILPVSARTGEGITALVETVRERLCSGAALQAPGAWIPR